MPQAAAKVTDAAQMRCCCSCGTVHIPAAPIQPLAQKLPYAAGMAIKTKKKSLDYLNAIIMNQKEHIGYSERSMYISISSEVRELSGHWSAAYSKHNQDRR